MYMLRLLTYRHLHLHTFSVKVILAFPTNQFGHQENSNGQEIINSLKHVRPGNGFEPKCIMFDKVRSQDLINFPRMPSQ